MKKPTLSEEEPAEKNDLEDGRDTAAVTAVVEAMSRDEGGGVEWWAAEEERRESEDG